VQLLFRAEAYSPLFVALFLRVFLCCGLTEPSKPFDSVLALDASVADYTRTKAFWQGIFIHIASFTEIIDLMQFKNINLHA